MNQCELYFTASFMLIALVRILAGTTALVHPTLVGHEYVDYTDQCDYATKPFIILGAASQVCFGIITLSLITIIQTTCQLCVANRAFAIELVLDMAYVAIALTSGNVDELVIAPVLMVHNLVVWYAFVKQRVYGDYYIQM